MRQQYVDVACQVRRQTREDVPDVRVKVVPVELGRLDQTHDGRSALARISVPANSQFLRTLAPRRICYSSKLLSIGSAGSSIHTCVNTQLSSVGQSLKSSFPSAAAARGRY